MLRPWPSTDYELIFEVELDFSLGHDNGRLNYKKTKDCRAFKDSLFND